MLGGKKYFFDLSNEKIFKKFRTGEIQQQAGMLVVTYGAIHQGFGQVKIILSLICF